jgi:hypothetical protein
LLGEGFGKRGGIFEDNIGATITPEEELNDPFDEAEVER